MESQLDTTLLEVDLHVIFTIPPTSKINLKYFTKITLNKEMRQCLIATAKVTFVALCYLIFVFRVLCLVLNRWHFNIDN